jgi:mannose-6-phosphate isomerase-like protein (cupin superfamily)
MAEYTAKRIDDMEAAFGGGFVKARAELGVTSFGMQVIRMPADYNDYPEHDHAADGQEEVYVALQGSGWFDIDGERVEFDKDVLVRIAAGTKRRVHSGPEGLQMLVIGGCPGEPYKVASFSELGTAA